MSEQPPQVSGKLPTASVVIPTHNRAGFLPRTLQALALQSYPAGDFEVIVAADGCTDDTVQVVDGFAAPYALQRVELPGLGPAAARNRGAEISRGRWLIFIDDDIEVAPGFIQAHLDAHAGGLERVVIGYLPTRLGAQSGYFRTELAGWWEKMFERMSEPGHRFGYTDLLSGNFSLEASLFAEVGGFDEHFRVHEDYELGLRLVRAGARFHFSRQAWGWHYENTDLRRALQRKYDEGLADIELCKLYPELLPNTLMYALRRYALLPSRVLQRLAFGWPALGDRLVKFLERFLGGLEGLRAYITWRRALDGLMGYWYWRGIAQKLKSRRAFEQFVQNALAHAGPQLSVPLVDLSQGLEQAEGEVESMRPEGLALCYGQTPVGVIPPRVGCERLNASHLRHALVYDLAVPLVRAYALNGALGLPAPSQQLVAWCEQEMKRTGLAAEFRRGAEQDQVLL